MTDKLTTLLQLLNKLPSYSSAFKDKTAKGYRIKCWDQLTASDLRKLKKATKGNSDIVKIDNEYVWKQENKFYGQTERVCCSIHLTKAPSKIIVRDL